jgi:hypothetical protein
MNSLLRKGIGIFKVKKINVYLDDEWILCDVKNNTTNENLINNTKNSLNCENIPKNFETYICSHSNIQTIPYTSNKPNIINNILVTNFNKPLSVIGENQSFISMCYDAFMNIIEEFYFLKVFFLYDDNTLPSIGI